ncbi:MAG: hypothetical protein DMF06_05320, partial [Verrucomicrobia bacterium]
MAGEYSPLDYGGAIAYANNAVPDYVTEQLKQAQAQAMRAAAVTNAQQEARLQQVEMDKRQKLADYQREVEELGANPTPQQVARFMVRNPDVADKIKSAYDMQDETTRRQNFTRISSLAILAQKDPKAVAAKLREQAASDPEPDDDLEVARMLDSDDEAERNQGLAQLHMLSYVATGDHDKYLEAHKAYETPEYKAIGDTNLITDNRGNIWRGPVTRGDSFIDPGYYNYPLLGGAAGPPATGGAAPAPAPAASGGFDVANAPQLHPETAFDRMLTVETNGRQ